MAPTPQSDSEIPEDICRSGKLNNACTSQVEQTNKRLRRIAQEKENELVGKIQDRDASLNREYEYDRQKYQQNVDGLNQDYSNFYWGSIIDPKRDANNNLRDMIFESLGWGAQAQNDALKYIARIRNQYESRIKNSNLARDLSDQSAGVNPAQGTSKADPGNPSFLIGPDGSMVQNAQEVRASMKKDPESQNSHLSFKRSPSSKSSQTPSQPQVKNSMALLQPY